ncbi:MAG: ATP synthase F0 subunit B [Oryzomonas sp.]|uniref:ATP synthase F0 subunit B n=1 Tax=Oryzomonas sp. TaxID=2855186 RepID=UPI00284EB2D0|nr:ATP synthase F0 subunit B [Oryzomonas sp.]MDR3578901.1 ATP synthase F0 subunit B [Oryzomonas sp.]
MIELNLAFFVQAVNFGILVLVLNIFLYKPIRKILADRRQVIDSAREKAASVDLEVQEKMARYEARLHEAKTEAAGRRAEALKEAQAEETALLEKARKEAAGSLDAIRSKVAKEAADARALLKQQADALSGDICEKILGRSL